MIEGRRVIVVVPAFNAESTIARTIEDLISDFVDMVIVVDDASTDATFSIASSFNVKAIRHVSNRGYGANQKTCYAAALEAGADIAVMVHGDYQYSPKLVPALAGMIASGHYDVALGSRILGGGALTGGMPWWRYFANRWLTMTENILLRQKLSEYHTGLRAWSREVLEALPLSQLSDDFVFDSQMLALAIYYGYRVGEMSCPTRYDQDASSINFRRSVRYGLGVLRVSVDYSRSRKRPVGIYRYSCGESNVGELS